MVLFYDSIYFDESGDSYVSCSHWGLMLFRRAKTSPAIERQRVAIQKRQAAGAT